MKNIPKKSKSEIRISKYETISNDQNSNDLNESLIKF